MLGRVRHWIVSPFFGEDYVREVDVAPEALVSRLRARINRPPKRALGVLKVSAEWVGAVAGSEFIVFEKQQHATMARGSIRGRRGGSRVEAHIGVRRRTWIMVVVFFALFVFGSYGLLQREEGMGLGPPGFAMAALGILVTLSLFWSASLRQRSALRAFLNEVFREPEGA